MITDTYTDNTDSLHCIIKTMGRKVDGFLYEKESYAIRGSFFTVYNALGGGLREKVIERALTAELIIHGLKVENQKRIEITYRDKKIGYYVPDLIINDTILIEIKSKPFILMNDLKQFWGYLKGSTYQLGFFVNFGQRKLDIRRFVHTKSALSA